MSRGVLYLIWGDSQEQVLKRSIASLQHFHPESPHRVVYMTDGSNLLAKSRMFELSPFDETLFLDADTVVLGNLEYGFIKAQEHGMALTHSACPWNRRYPKIDQHPDEVEYSSGVVFFDKSRPWVDDIFKAWNKNNSKYDSSTQYQTDSGEIKTQEFNDQALLSLAIQQIGYSPFVLSQNWNLVPRWQKTFWGEIKIWHSYSNIPQSVIRWNAQQKENNLVACATLPGDL